MTSFTASSISREDTKAAFFVGTTESPTVLGIASCCVLTLLLDFAANL